MGVVLSDQKFWNQIKTKIQKNSKSRLIHSALAGVKMELEKNHFTLVAPSLFHQKILKDQFFYIQEQAKEKGFSLKGIKTLSLKEEPPASFVKTEAPPKREKKDFSPRAFSPEWTFSSFVSGPNNSFALALAQSVAKHPTQKSTNPLFLYGPSGLGKTHLLHAIGNFLEQTKPQLRVKYLAAERFFNDCISHIRQGQMPQFRQKYRQNIQVLLLDDVQILGKGESIQEEFFHTFESLKQAGTQIVLAGDQKPQSIKGLKARIKTRFEGGVVADIQPPDKDTKRAILQSKAKKQKISLSEEIIARLANEPFSSVREMEGALNKIKMFCELKNTPPTVSLVKRLVTVLTPARPSVLLKPEEKNIRILQKVVCDYFQVPFARLKSRERSKPLAYIRNIAIFLMRNELSLPLAKIGQYLGERDHSTVVNSLKRIYHLQRTDPKVLKDIQGLQELFHKKINLC